jgi:hypothetical protein
MRNEHQFKQLIRLVSRDLAVLNSQIQPNKLIVHIREGLEQEFPNERDYAYTYDDNGDYIIVISNKMYRARLATIRAIMRHELAHAMFFLKGKDQHSEQETDDLAEQIWGDRIYYDDNDVQTLKHGQYPRPAHLHQ